MSFDKAFEYIRSRFRNGRLEIDPKAIIVMKLLEIETSMSTNSILDGLSKIENAGDEHYTLNSFVALCKQVANEKRKPAIQYELIMPINTVLTKRVIDFRGRKYRVLSDKKAMNIYGDIAFTRFNAPELPTFKISTHQKYFLRTSVSATNMYEAVIEIFSEVESLCGLVNLIFDKDRFVYAMSKSSNEAAFDLGTVVYAISDENSEYLNWNFLTRGIKATRTIRKLSILEKEDLNKTLKALKNLDSRLKFMDSLLLNALTLYYRAKTSIENENEFMYYWRICENIVLSDDVGGDSSKTMNRVFGLINFFEKFDISGSKVVNKLRQIRNDFVHKGRIDFDKYFTSIMGALANSLIHWLIKNRGRFHSETEFALYLRNKDIDNSKLNSMLSALKTIMDERK